MARPGWGGVRKNGGVGNHLGRSWGNILWNHCKKEEIPSSKNILFRFCVGFQYRIRVLQRVYCTRINSSMHFVHRWNDTDLIIGLQLIANFAGCLSSEILPCLAMIFWVHLATGKDASWTWKESYVYIISAISYFQPRKVVRKISIFHFDRSCWLLYHNGVGKKQRLLLGLIQSSICVLRFLGCLIQCP